MKELVQLFRHDPERNVHGDCHRTALACLLDFDTPAQSPHFIGKAERAKRNGKTFDWQAAQERWLNALGYSTVDISYGDGGPDADREILSALLGYMHARNPRALYLLGGRSPRGTNHTIIARGNQLRWDPHPDGGFIIGPLDNGYYEITFLIPYNLTE